MTRTRIGAGSTRAAGVALWLALVAACEAPPETTTPAEAAGEGEPLAIPTTDAGATAAPVAETGTPTQRVLPKDRDPEEEKRKMSLSRQRSKAARDAFDSRRYDQAIQEARQALKIHEQNVEAMLVIAEVFYVQKKYEIVQSVTSSVLQVDPEILAPDEASQAHNLRGFAYLALGQDDAALQAFRKAADGDPNNATAWNNVGVQYLVQGDAQTAASCFAYAVQLDPAFAQAHLNHGSALRKQGQLVAAETAFKRALELRKDLPEAHFNLGVLYLDADPFPELETTVRLNRAITELTRFKQSAMKTGAATPTTTSESKMPGAGRDPSEFGNELVTLAQADLYIEAARKGIEREKRRIEREKRRAEKAGSERELQAPKSEESGDTGTSDAGTTPQRPGAAPAPQAPGEQTPKQAPKPQEPPNSPKTEDPSPPPQSPQRPAPSPEPPATQGPKAQQPKAPAPQRPGSGGDTPAPKKPSSPPSAQRPTVQRPGG